MVGGEEDEYSLDGDKVCRSVIKNNNTGSIKFSVAGPDQNKFAESDLWFVQNVVIKANVLKK